MRSSLPLSAAFPIPERQRRCPLGAVLLAFGCAGPAPGQGGNAELEPPDHGAHATSSSPGEEPETDGRGTFGGDDCPDDQEATGWVPDDQLPDGALPSSPCGGGTSFECDLHDQDCPSNEACVPWANDGTFVWNAVRCAPLASPADALGDTCEVEGGGMSGISSCALGSMCLDVDRDSLIGVCSALCDSHDECPGDERCVSLNGGALPVCRRPCDPMASTCGADQSCVPAASAAQWVCMRPARPLAAVGESCDRLNGCEVGSFCLVTEGAAGTWPDGQCVAPCDPNASDPTCATDESCWPLAPNSEDPISSASLGVCGSAPLVEPRLGASLPAAADAGAPG